MPDLPVPPDVNHYVWPTPEGDDPVRAFDLVAQIAPGARSDQDRRPLTLYRCVRCLGLVDVIGMGGHWDWHRDLDRTISRSTWPPLIG